MEDHKFVESMQLTDKEANDLTILDWYMDSAVCIRLSAFPTIVTKDANKYLQEEDEYESAKRWPFQLTHNLAVSIIDYRNPIYKLEQQDNMTFYGVPEYPRYHFRVSQDYCFDGATIMRVFWRLIGAPSDPRFLVGALLHDVMCQHHEYINYDRKLSSIVLERCLRCTGTSWITRIIMYWFVELFQKFIRRW